MPNWADRKKKIYILNFVLYRLLCPSVCLTLSSMNIYHFSEKLFLIQIYKPYTSDAKLFWSPCITRHPKPREGANAEEDSNATGRLLRPQKKCWLQERGAPILRGSHTNIASSLIHSNHVCTIVILVNITFVLVLTFKCTQISMKIEFSFIIYVMLP